MIPGIGSLFVFTVLASFALVSDASADTGHRVYAQLLEPQEHPDYNRRHVRPPGWDLFGNRTQFVSLRGFGIKDDQIVNYTEEIDKYTLTYDLGDVIWPSYPIIFAKNLGDLADEIKRRDLFLFDIWGYVPGSGPEGYWQQFKPPEGVFDLLESKLGQKWLGMDVGEQDGRYVGGYASQMYPASASRFQQYLNFQRHFQRMCDDLGNKMSTLVSLNFGHYFLKEGVYTLIGAETAQALPNGQVYYSFIRGAGKQYGVPWFGNASVYNRWGYKTYGSTGDDHGPTKGTSLNLMKRFMYSHILYNCMVVGFESSWFEGDGLSPIGRIQQAAHQWVKKNAPPGAMVTPVAVMVDFFSGWSFPRHLYTRDVYRVWGNLPYEAGDHLTDGVLDMFYPGYQDCSYFHDESGFISPTPYGDSADGILSDASGWLLDRYPMLVVAGELSGGTEIRDKLRIYAQNGGHLFITAGNLAKLPGGIAGIEVAGDIVSFDSSDVVQCGQVTMNEDTPFQLYPVTFPANADILAQCGEMPAVIEIPLGDGLVTVFTSPYGVCSGLATTDPITNEVDKSLVKPYPLLKHVRAVLDEAFRRQMLFDVGENLSLITCRKKAGEYTLGICNNSLQEQPLKIVSNCGVIEAISEIPIDQSEKKATGYLPEGFEDVDVGISGDKTIAGGDVRIFSVRVSEENVSTIPHVKPPPHPKGRTLPLRGIRSIKEEILARPTFFDYFDGVVIDWKYFQQREKDILQQEAGWIKRQSLRVIVDLTSGINLYPGLRLIDNVKEDYLASMAVVEDILSKMEIMDSHDLILSLHRSPENNFTNEQTRASFEATLRKICKRAEAVQVNVHLRMCHGKPPWSIDSAMQLIQGVNAPNLLLAPSTALLLAGEAGPAHTAGILKNKLGLWFACAPAFDVAGRLWNANAPIAGHDQKDRIAEFLAIDADAIVILDGVYKDHDEEYLDAHALNHLIR